MAELGRWLELCRRANAKGAPEAIYDRLAELYSRPARAYHSLDHVAHCLDEFATARHLAVRPNEVEMAIWFHDAIYVPGARDNEARSAELARQCCREMKLPKAFGKRVFHLVIATQHLDTPQDPDARLIADVDLAILGQSPERFDDYEQQIRREYAAVPDEEFWARRADLLRGFLARTHIYATDHFRDRYEAAARRNLERSLQRVRT